ncbi:hypothetical protein [Pedobacter sp. SYP-B3415]|uniref:hypothetical protein n=1 Tax=Pedobacter sp. SYP-B3415 TaxID=2496641 RepID=UPI00101DFB4C|nr:hypothetical protein [Pedobacter sp. SYP-B3415]
MTYYVHSVASLRKILWADSILGGITAIVGITLAKLAGRFLGLPVAVVFAIAVITLLYALLAFSLAIQKRPPVLRLVFLIRANWFWTGVSIFLLIRFISGCTVYGAIFLILQVLVVGLLALLEGRHLMQTEPLS